MKKTGKNDLILIGGVLILALVVWGIMRYVQTKSTVEAVAVVTVDGQVYGEYPLDRDVTERIEFPDGTYNVLEIKDGVVDMTEASCPDQICVYHYTISKNQESIVCLPNKVIITIENGEETEVDSVTN
jgi:hypothetical protein